MTSLIVSTVSSSLSLLAQASGSTLGRNSMMAESPFTDYTAGVALYVIAVGFLAVLVVAGGILALNLGLMSKRSEDRLGGRTPSDVGILKDTIWPDERQPQPILPAEDDDVQTFGMEIASSQPPSHQGRAQEGRADEGYPEGTPLPKEGNPKKAA